MGSQFLKVCFSVFFLSPWQAQECTARQSGSNIIAITVALPQFGPWVSCSMTWCVVTSHSNTMRRSQEGRSSFGGEFLQVNTHCSACMWSFTTCLIFHKQFSAPDLLVLSPPPPPRMPAADQVVSIPAASWPPILRGHYQPLVDAEHVLLRSPNHSADGEDNHRDQAAQHRPRAHSLHPHPRGCGSVMEVRSGLNQTLQTQETITNRLM